MAPITKENDVLTPAPNAPSATSTGFRPDETASRPQPVALELPVTVNGARTVEGSDKREPFSETTKTVLVFGNGAVLRLSSPVAPGQLLFLTNEKTKKEVVCQVVKSKNYRNVSGYVELEFTEAVVGFWGMRFPTDRIAPQPSAQSTPPGARVTPIAPPPAPARTAPVAPPAAPSPVSAIPTQPTLPASEPSPPVPSAAPKSPEPILPQVQAPLSPAAQIPVLDARPAFSTTPEAPASLLEPAPVSVVPTLVFKQPESPVAALSDSLASSVMNLLSSPEVPPAVPPASAAPKSPLQGADTASTEELKLQAARLQEQLSALAFSGTPEEKPSPKKLSNEDNANIAAKLLDMAKAEVAPVKPLAPARIAPPPVHSSLDSEEVKIPSWLEPLARNAAAPSSTQDSVEKEKAKHAAETEAHTEAPEEDLPASAPEGATQTQFPGIGSLLPLDEEVATRERSSGRSKTGMWIGVAAAVVLLAGGAWYVMRPAASGQGAAVQSAGAPIVSKAANADKGSVAISSAAVQPASQPAPQTSAAFPELPAKPTKSETASAPAGRSTETPQPVPVARDNARDSAAAIPAAETERLPKRTGSPAAPAAAPAEPEAKKQSIGEVHLATPMLNRPTTTKDEGEAPSISSSNSDAPSTNLGAGLEEASSQPAAPEAPLRVGGDVKPAKLLSAVSPAYPPIAKSQHIQGDVQIDALINENGKVTTMKVISGPGLLHQAAMDALRQWKYAPATLDGKPVAMHLSVTLKFRTQ